MSKYNAIRTTIDGITFDSKAEAKRYCELKLLERAKEISHLEVHRIFPLTAHDQFICNYEADFSYSLPIESIYSSAPGKYVVEDVKGVKTPVYQIKKKIMMAQYGIKITEITKRSRR